MKFPIFHFPILTIRTCSRRWQTIVADTIENEWQQTYQQWASRPIVIHTPIENIEWREINKFIWCSQNCESLSVEVERCFATRFDTIHFDSLVVRVLPSATGLFSFISLCSPPFSFGAVLFYIVSHHIGCHVRPHFFFRSFAFRRLSRRCCSNHFDSICSPRRFTRKIVFILLISLVDGTQSGFYCISHIGILIRISSTT